MTLEYRDAVNAQIKDADEVKREVQVIFPHDVRDSYDTTFGIDAFRDSFSHQLPVVCWQHQMNEPIGRTISAQVTSAGNELVSRLSDFNAVPLAHRAFSQLSDGTFDNASFGFARISDEAHPEMRGVTRITKATMKEWSPVTIGAIPGAVVTGTRAEDVDGLAMPTIAEILQLRDAGVLDVDEARAMLAVRPEYREHITITAPAVAVDDGLSDWDPDVVELLARSAGGMEAAGQYLSDVDLTSLPEPVQSAIALMNASATALDEARSIVGEPPEAEDAEERAETTFSDAAWDFKQSDYTDAQYIAACLIKGKTKDDSALPVKDPDGTYNTNGIHAAAQRLGQVKASPADKTAAAKALLSLYGQMKEKAPPSLLQAARAEEIELERREAEALEKLARLG